MVMAFIGSYIGLNLSNLRCFLITELELKLVDAVSSHGSCPFLGVHKERELVFALLADL